MQSAGSRTVCERRENAGSMIVSFLRHLISLLLGCSSLTCTVACREYAALKVVTEQDVYNRMRKEQKREAKRQRQYTV